MEKRGMKRWLSLSLAVLLCLNSISISNAEESITVSGGETPLATVSAGDLETVSENSVSNNLPETQNMTVEDELQNNTVSLSKELYEEKISLQTVATQLNSLESGQDYREHEVVTVANSIQEASEIAECYDATVLECAEGIAVLRVDAGVKDVVRLAADTDNDFPVVYPNYIYTIEDILNGEDTADDVEFNKQWHHNTLETKEAWHISMGESVLVSIVDTGIDTDHPDLIANIKGVENSLDEVSSAEDGHGHGTHVAGIIAASMNNGLGGAGVAPKASILAVKAMGDDGYGTTASIVRGIYLSMARGAKIINLSVSSFVYDELNQRAIWEAVEKGCIVVGAAGNSATDQKVYPAAYEQVIAVGATDEHGNLSSFSNYGNWVDIAAPGTQIYSTVLDGGYGYKSGTSMATPMVTATVALLLASKPELLALQDASCARRVEELLRSTREEKNYICGNAGVYGGLNAKSAVAGSTVTEELAPPCFEVTEVTGKKNTIYAGEDFPVKISSDNPKAEIYYTLNGKKPTKTTGILYTEPILLEKTGAVTIKAVAIAGEHVSQVETVKYNLVVPVKTITPLYGEKQVLVKGKSIKLQVSTAPSYATNKKVAWTLLEKSSDAIRFNSNTGTVSCTKNAQDGEKALIKAVAKDGSGAETTIEIVVAASASVPVLNVSELILTSIEDLGNEQLAEMKKNFQLEVLQGERYGQYLFTSTNKKVATVDENGLITAVGKGTAQIKVTLKDGTNKSAICKVKVITPVVNINTLKTSTGFYQGDETRQIYYGSDYIGENAVPIAKGCKITIKPYLNEDDTWRSSKLKDTNKPTNSKIIWTSDDTSILTVKNGVVSCKKDAVAGQTVTVTATAADGYGATRSITFVVCDKINRLYFQEEGKRYNSGYTKTIKAGDNIEAYDQMLVAVSNGKATSAYEITISNRDLAAVFRSERRIINGKTVVSYVYDENGKTICTLKKGTCKITFKARDGSNRKIVLKLKIV